jgi:hypothetical protein
MGRAVLTMRSSPAVIASALLLSGCLHPAPETPCGDTQTSPQDCGACGHDCQGGTCLAGVCQPFVLVHGDEHQSSVSYGGLALDAENLYWTDASGVGAVPLSGGAPRRIAIYPAQNRGIAVGGDEVYWTTTSLSVVSRAPKAARTVVPDNVAFAELEPVDVAVDRTTVYWTDNLSEFVMGAPLDGGAPSAAAVDPCQGPYAIAVDETHIYWTNVLDGTVNSAPKGGSGYAVALASNQGFPSGIALDGTNVYWASNGDGTVMAVPLAGSVPVCLASGEVGVVSVVVDARYAYWSLPTNHGELRRVPLGGGDVTTIGVACPPANMGDTPMPPATCGHGQAGAGLVAVDATSVYWTTAIDIVKMAKAPSDGP